MIDPLLSLPSSHRLWLSCFVACWPAVVLPGEEEEATVGERRAKMANKNKYHTKQLERLGWGWGWGCTRGFSYKAVSLYTVPCECNLEHLTMFLVK